jgi:hypothetical protein
VRRLLVTANVPISTILVTLMMEALSSSEKLSLIRATRRNVPEDILHSHRRENLKCYISVQKFGLSSQGDGCQQVLAVQNSIPIPVFYFGRPLQNCLNNQDILLVNVRLTTHRQRTQHRQQALVPLKQKTNSVAFSPRANYTN